MSTESQEVLSKEQLKQLKKREKYNKYYHAHKEHIRQYRKESGVAHKSYEIYYEKKKEYLRQRNLQRYYEKKALKQQELTDNTVPTVHEPLELSPLTGHSPIEDLPVIGN